MMQTRSISTQTNGCWSILMLLLCGKSDSISIKAFFFQGEEGEGKLPKRRLLKKVRRGPPFLIIIMIYPLLDSRPERLYCVLVLDLQYSCVLGFPNTPNWFCKFPNTIQYNTILKKLVKKMIKE